MDVAGINYTYEGYKLSYVLNYVPDFTLANGIIIEAKGYFRPGDTTKMLAVKREHPELDIRFIFQDADKPVSRMKITHGGWAIKNGFPYADGRIPQEWLEHGSLPIPTLDIGASVNFLGPTEPS